MILVGGGGGGGGGNVMTHFPKNPILHCKQISWFRFLDVYTKFRAMLEVWNLTLNAFFESSAYLHFEVKLIQFHSCMYP